MQDTTITAQPDQDVNETGQIDLPSMANGAATVEDVDGSNESASSAVGQHSSSPTNATHQIAPIINGQSRNLQPIQSGRSVPVNASVHATPFANSYGHIVCPSIASIPPGRQAARILKCGITTCTSTKLFDRKHELERHMKTHDPGEYPCTVFVCIYAVNGFKRKEHLRNHLRKVHSLTLAEA